MKQAFGGIMCLLGIAGLIYGGYLMASGSFNSWSVVIAVIGVVFLFAGISLLKDTRTPEEK